ncbi:ClbS/DfsB family four-helix bundle protein [Achromobacter xylosoxidans]|uniref:ClbS/DfsB family four-helix bundle protein n=1 Tax=Alcaligenes xylosoxydans xylosoxydans TaxID=85698 RepID=UPI001EEE23F0|nr:ClbS/DfsB family four-helix bundle protein [Achromobacter xylosoxidans]
MQLPTSKLKLLHNIRGSHRKFRIEAATIPAAQYRVTAIISQEPRLHTNAATVLVDLILWNTMILQLASDRTSGHSASFYTADSMVNRVERLSAVFQRRFEGSGLCDLESLLTKGQDRVIDCVEQHSDASLFDPSISPMMTLGRKIQFFTSTAYDDALLKLRQWKRII